MLNSSVIGTGHHQPATVMTNDDLAQRVETNDEWIQRRTGIRERRIAGDDEQVADLATPAATQALYRAQRKAADIDMVVVATCTSRDRCPSTAAEVAGRLGTSSAVCFDVNNACAGFSTSLGLADSAIRSGQAENVLVIGAEKMSDVTDWADRSSCILLGDGAGAGVVTATTATGIFPTIWGTDVTKRDNVTVRGKWQSKFSQNGPEVFRWATSEMPSIAHRAVEAAGLRMSDIGAVIPHQANLRIIDPLIKELGFSNAVIARDIITSGNTSAASVPLALSKLGHVSFI